MLIKSFNNIILYFFFNKYYILYKQNNIIYYYLILLNNKISLKNKYFLFNFNIKNIYFFKLFNIGLGFKNFIYNNKFFLYLGDANLLKINFNTKIKIICKKNQIIFLSKNKNLLFNFINKILNIKKINIYKGKGIIYYNNFKFMKLKKGKKKN
jgi:hypothetical protein